MPQGDTCESSPPRCGGAASGGQVARTAGYNVASAVAAGLGGIIVARALGPEMRGEYAAVTAWFGVVLMVGTMGQPAALCFYVARDPARPAATSRPRGR